MEDDTSGRASEPRRAERLGQLALPLDVALGVGAYLLWQEGQTVWAVVLAIVAVLGSIWILTRSLAQETGA